MTTYLLDDFRSKVGLAIEWGFCAQIANEFKIAESTVERWTRGVSRPHPIVQKSVMDFIDLLVETDTHRDPTK